MMKTMRILKLKGTTMIYKGTYRKICWSITEEVGKEVKWVAGFRGTGIVSSLTEAENAVIDCIDNSLELKKEV